MSSAYQIYDQHGTYFLTLTVVDWVDVFSRKVYRDIIMDSLAYCIKEKGLQVYGYVIMTNHVHLIVSSANGTLSDTLRDFKKFTANAILEAIMQERESRRHWLLHRFEWNASQHQRNSKYQVWMHGSHAIEITSYNFFRQKLDYIHANPVRAGWVDREEDYVYSSANALYNDAEMKLILSYWHE
ncbi:MAG: transposase [Bacteroidetes bacterium]|nr:transposase [Bacteroidota bacterium]